MENRRFPERCTCFEEQDRAGKVLSKTAQADVVRAIQRLYSTGVPLFDKTVIATLDTAICERHAIMNLVGVDGNMSVSRPDWISFETHYEPRIGFRTIQNMINGVPPDGRMRTCGALSSYRVACFPRHTAPSSRATLSSIKRLWDIYQKLWQQSQTCSVLMEIMGKLPPHCQVTKVVCFGLGALLPNICRTCGLCLNSVHCKIHKTTRSRTFTQHAAAVSIMLMLRQQNPHLQCYSQEPEYSPECRNILRGLDIIVVDGHKGFLEVDDRTLVISIKPAVPVKQIITELARPAVIIWDAMDGDERDPDEGNPDKWQLLTRNGSQYWQSPYGVDPDSSRTRNMLTYEYASVPFPGDVLNFGPLDIHIRQPADTMAGGSALQIGGATAGTLL
ncbi:hypothetical protein BDP55DRAFT_755775 [Colletotrichum godetiae]|uniref:SRR1-like domain-containing protein n=1 Tax=Colletotrichum godetiae TaxID=1209918 RepID=A0AAJ0AY19_9PEZI|nr:uncharacterized protein BDP55DRAFT_755775 [Colletotrichum godetiae]KAK1690214.1 hypothetical protein BDP55DRAFT_755775 [Colletotrichum godetiae]